MLFSFLQLLSSSPSPLEHLEPFSQHSPKTEVTMNPSQVGSSWAFLLPWAEGTVGFQAHEDAW